MRPHEIEFRVVGPFGLIGSFDANARSREVARGLSSNSGALGSWSTPSGTQLKRPA
jgi:hypothetical protein